MKNKKFVIIGLIVILIIAIVSVFVIGTQNKSWYGHKDWKKSEEHPYKNFGDKSDWLEKLGLPDDASEEEVKEALQRWKEENNFHSKESYNTSGFSHRSWCGKS